MGLLSRVAQIREEQILSNATPHVEDGEEVIQWVRVRNFEGKRGRGFMFLTPARIILVWTRGGGDEAQSEYGKIEAWGVNREIEGGPVIAVECEGADISAKLPVTTTGMAGEVRRFLKTFADNAPAPRRTLRPQPHPGPFEPRAEVDVEPKRRSITEHTKRILITILGLVMVIGGILMIPLPGPWSLPIIVGGLAVLATEYDWADDMLDWVKRGSKQLAAKVRGRRRKGKKPTPKSHSS